MKQRSLAESGYERRPKATKRQRFLMEMDVVIPWARLVGLAEPVQPKMGARWADVVSGGNDAADSLHAAVVCVVCPGMEEALHDISALRAFTGLDAGDDRIPG